MIVGMAKAKQAGDWQQAADAVTRDREAGRLKADAATWKAKYESACAEIDAWERRFELCSGLGQVTPITIPPRPKQSRSNATAAILVLTDWHALDEMKALHEKKAADYGTDGDPLANLRASAEFGIEPWLATLIRFGDKVQRLKTFAQKRTLANEGVEDTLKDAAAYALLALVLFEEAKHGEGESTT